MVNIISIWKYGYNSVEGKNEISFLVINSKNHTEGSINEIKSFRDNTPYFLQTISPFLKRINVGTPLILYLVDAATFLSTSTFKTRSFSP